MIELGEIRIRTLQLKIETKIEIQKGKKKNKIKLYNNLEASNQVVN